MTATYRIALTGFAAVMLAAALLAADPRGAAADADGPDYWSVVGVAPDASLNVHAGPSTAEPVVGTLPHDAGGIRNLGCTGGLSFEEYLKATAAEREAGRRTRWCRIAYRGVTGWAAGWHLGEGAAPR